LERKSDFISARYGARSYGAPTTYSSYGGAYGGAYGGGYGGYRPATQYATQQVAGGSATAPVS